MKRWSTACTVLASVLLFFSIGAGLINHNVLDEQNFARNVDQVRQDPDVARAVGERISQAAIRINPNLVVLRPAVESVSISVAGSSTLSPLVRQSAAVLHQSVTGEQSDGIALRLLDIGTVLSGVLPSVSPTAADHISPDMSVTLAQVSNHSMSGRLIHLVRWCGLLSWLLPLLALLFFAVGIAIAPDRQRSAARSGIGITACGGGITLVAVAGSIAASLEDEKSLTGALVSASWQQLAAQLWWSAALAILMGLVVVAATSARLPDADIAALARRGWQLATERPENRRAVACRGAILLLLGAGAIFRPGLTFGVLAGLVGIVVLVTGLAELAFAAGFRPRAASDAEASPRQRHLATSVALAVTALVVAALVVVALLPPSEPATASSSDNRQSATSRACNGHVELCNRRYDDVSFPAAHNAMSAADESGWYVAEQSTGIIGSLDAGVRVLLIDSYYGQRSKKPGLVITAPQSRAAAIAEARTAYGDSVVASTVRLRDSVTSAPVGPVGEYLCHGLCELGSTEWEPTMAKVHTWMTAHPREVITFFIEDNVSPADTAKIFREAGLLPYVYTPRNGKPWPTLGSMISSGRRLVVLMQRHGGGHQYPWLLQGFDWVQDTPYTNPRVASLSCRLNRGSKSDDLLLLNYWLTNFNTMVTDARRVNKYDVLWPYVTRCEQERKQLPNFVAVNYATKGDLFKVIDKLNGVG